MNQTIELPFSVRIYNLTKDGEIPLAPDNDYTVKKEFNIDELLNINYYERKLGSFGSEFFVKLNSREFFILNENQMKSFKDFFDKLKSDFQDEEKENEI